MTLTNAQRQSQWRERRNALAKASVAERLEDLTAEHLAEMTARRSCGA